MPDNEITVPVTEDPCFKFERELNGSTKLFTLDYLPHIGLLSPDPSALLIPAMAFQLFNPNSLPNANMVQVGDLIQVSSDPNDPIYKAWNPPAEYRIEEGYSKMFKVKYLTEDALGFPCFIADEAL